MTDAVTYGYDDSHPIPDLTVVDVNTVKKGGGSDLFIIIASPLDASERSLRRLLRKIEVYLAFIQSEQFRAESGAATPDNTRIIVNLHRGSAPQAFDLINRNENWVRNNGASLEIDTDSIELTH